jgi:beta-lactamase superfamily II metal-dependent hydrolase
MSEILIVYDVGHGNWNEIRNKDYRLFFDIGASKYYKEKDLRSLIQRANLKTKSKVTIVISHWDVDHYHVLFGMEKSELQRIEKVIAPEPPKNKNGNVPNTIDKAIKLLENEGVVTELVPKSKKTNKSTRKIELHVSQSIKSNIILYRTTGAKNKNLDSIVLYHHSSNKSVLLTGDNYYDKVYEYILANKKIDGLVMVVPHHGGKAGKFVKRDWKAIPIETVVCSWGDNNYGHSLNTLKKVVGNTFHKIEETNNTGSKQILL